MMNLQLVKEQPRWRVALVARFAQLMGVLVHVEGIPFGKDLSRARRFETEVGSQATHLTQSRGV